MITLKEKISKTPVEAEYSSLDWREAVRIVEDYKPLDIQSATMEIALLKGIKARYPEWRYLGMEPEVNCDC